MPAAGKILIIRGGAIGDFILTLPVLAALRERFPEAQIEVLGYPNVTTLATAAGLAHRSLSIESRALARFFAPRSELDPGLREYFSQFALIFSYLYDPDKFFETNVKSCFKGQFIIGPHRPSDPSMHATDSLLAPLRSLAIFDADPYPHLRFAPAKLPEDRWIALHPGSGSEKKNWPIGAWIRFCQLMQSEFDYRLLLIGGEAERDKLEQLASSLETTKIKILKNLPLVEVATHLAACQAFIGHDSGISHLAAAVGLPGVIIWGETDPNIWRPRSPKMQLLNAGSELPTLQPERVIEMFRAVGPH
jgi:ADP-heptose:LPS heptosyltransferase